MPRPEPGVGVFPPTHSVGQPGLLPPFTAEGRASPHVSGCPGDSVAGYGSGGYGPGGCPCPAGRARCAVRGGRGSGSGAEGRGAPR